MPKVALVTVVLWAALGVHAAHATTATNTDCVLGAWAPEEGCQADTLKQKWIRTVTYEPTIGACSPLRETRPCKPTNCQMSAWSNWTDACNSDGYKTRTRTQLQAPVAGGRECPHSVDSVRCCDDDCRVGAWSDWTCDTSINKLTRYRNVTKPAKAPTGKPCPINLFEIGDSCGPPKVDCVLFTVEEDPGSWGSCVVGDNFIHTQSKVLGIKIQRSGGGKACVVPTQRTVHRLCPFTNYVDWFDQPDYSNNYVATQTDSVNIKFGKPWTAELGESLPIPVGSMQPYVASSPNTVVFQGGVCPGGSTYTITLDLVCGDIRADPNPKDITNPSPCNYRGKLFMKTLEICPSITVPIPP